MYGEATGYTYPITEGKITTGAEFLRRCVRAFGACCVFREESLDIPLEKLMDEYMIHRKSDHYLTRYGEVLKEYGEFVGMSKENGQALLKETREKEIGRAEETLGKMKKDRIAYDKIRREVIEWVPPTTEHVSIKKFALVQIDSCIPSESEIAKEEIYISELRDSLDHLDEEYESWRKTRIEKFEWDINYYKSHGAKETENYDGSVLYLNQFLESLKNLPKE